MEEHSGFNVLKRSDIEERVKRRDSEYSGAVQRGCVKQAKGENGIHLEKARRRIMLLDSTRSFSSQIAFFACLSFVCVISREVTHPFLSSHATRIRSFLFKSHFRRERICHFHFCFSLSLFSASTFHQIILHCAFALLCRPFISYMKADNSRVMSCVSHQTDGIVFSPSP